MLVKILEAGRSAFTPGQLVRIGDKQGENLIRLGMAERMPDSAMRRPNRDRRQLNNQGSQRSRTPAPPMLPARFICGCGYVGKDAEQLAEHKAGCR